MKYIKKFNSIEEYNTFLDSADYVIPNVCQVGSDIITTLFQYHCM